MAIRASCGAYNNSYKSNDEVHSINGENDNFDAMFILNHAGGRFTTYKRFLFLQ